MNVLALEVRSFHVETEQGEHVTRQAEFVIDGIGLSERLGFEGLRPMLLRDARAWRCFVSTREYSRRSAPASWWDTGRG